MKINSLPFLIETNFRTSVKSYLSIFHNFQYNFYMYEFIAIVVVIFNVETARLRIIILNQRTIRCTSRDFETN